MRMRVWFGVLTLMGTAQPALAQWYEPDNFGGYERRWREFDERDDDRRYDRDRSSQSDEQPSGRADDIVAADGGARPFIRPEAPNRVAFPYAYPAASIVIDTAGRKLYYVIQAGQAFAYPISVGREGFSWTGQETISRKQAWPDWFPPADMRQRDPKLPQKMLGGERNPLGAMALYLGNTLYRIHGTSDAKSIGRAASSGCFRMNNAHVLHLAQFAQVGTVVTVVSHLPSDGTAQIAEQHRDPAKAQRTAPAPRDDDDAIDDRADRDWPPRRFHRRPLVIEPDDPDDYVYSDDRRDR